MDHTIYKIYKNDANYLEAAILTPKSGGWRIHDYVVMPGPMDKATIEHYDLVFVSHP